MKFVSNPYKERYKKAIDLPKLWMLEERTK